MTVKPPDERSVPVVGGALLLLRQLPCLTGWQSLHGFSALAHEHDLQRAWEPLHRQQGGGSLWLYVDYRRLNSVSESDVYSMPCIDDLIDKLGEARFISTLDLTRGYWQVPVAEEARHKMAFAMPFGLYELTVMPFGLQGALATFQCLMDRIVNRCENFAATWMT